MIRRCERCQRSLDAIAAYRFYGPSGPALRCRGCTLTHGALLRRSLAIALVVGTVLLVINQGDVLLAGRWPPALVWKIPLTYLVPFVVATLGALLNSRAK